MAVPQPPLKAMLLPETYPELFIAISRFSNHRVARHRAKGGSHSQSSAVASQSSARTAATYMRSATRLPRDPRSPSECLPDGRDHAVGTEWYGYYPHMWRR